MKNPKENVNGMILCLFELVVGILLLIKPIDFTSSIITVAGVFLLIVGLISIVKYFKADAQEAAVGQNLVKGLVAMVAGAFCALNSHWFIATFPVLTMIYGAVILVTGLGKVQLAVDMLRLKNEKWFWAAVSAGISVICAIVILNNPFASTVVLWVFIGISLLVEAVLDIITFISGGKVQGDTAV